MPRPSGHRASGWRTRTGRCRGSPGRCRSLVLVEGHDHVAGVDGAAEELDAVVGVGEDLDVGDVGAAADAAEGEAVDLLVGRIVNVAAVADRDVV